MNCYKRDYDFLGYRYALMSQLATAGLNNVLCMIPARDESEFTLFPKEDVAFIRDWLAWTDAHIDFLKNTVPLPNMDEVALGLVDGSAAFAHPLSCNFSAAHSNATTQQVDSPLGFIWFFNPGYSATSASVTLDDSLSPFDSCSTSAHTGGRGVMQTQYYDVTQLYPISGKTERVAFGSEHTIQLAGSSAVMLQVSASAAHLNDTIPLGIAASAVSFDATGKLKIVDLVGEIGTIVRDGRVHVPLNTAGECQALQMRALEINGRTVFSDADARTAISSTKATLSRDGRCELQLPPLHFGGAVAPFPHAAPVVLKPGRTDPDGNATFTGNTIVPKQIFAQLAARQRAYPVSSSSTLRPASQTFFALPRMPHIMLPYASPEQTRMHCSCWVCR